MGWQRYEKVRVFETGPMELFWIISGSRDFCSSTILMTIGNLGASYPTNKFSFG
jgi:hypothetical protein